MTGLGTLRVDGVAKRSVDQAQRGAVHHVQYQITEDWQESRTETESEEAGTHERQENYEGKHPGEESKCQTATHVRPRNARLDKVRIDEGEAHADTKMDRNCGVEHVRGVFNHDVIRQALEPGRVRLGACLF